jgi:cytochrome c biogenesis protein CcdA
MRSPYSPSFSPVVVPVRPVAFGPNIAVVVPPFVAVVEGVPRVPAKDVPVQPVVAAIGPIPRVVVGVAFGFVVVVAAAVAIGADWHEQRQRSRNGAAVGMIVAALVVVVDWELWNVADNSMEIYGK